MLVKLKRELNHAMRIVIQRDSRIAIFEHRDEMRYADVDDPMDILHWLRASVEFEEGLTVRQLMKSLRPWKETIGHLAWMDFDAWFSSIDKTHLVPVDAEIDDEEPDLECLEIYNIISIHRYEEEKVAYISDHWDFHARYVRPTVSMGMEIDTCSVSFSPPHIYANLPIKIDVKTDVIDLAVGPPEGMRPILKEAMPGSFDHLSVPPTFFDTVILGFLDNLSFHGTPNEAQEAGDHIFGLVAEIKDRQLDKEETLNSVPAEDLEKTPGKQPILLDDDNIVRDEEALTDADDVSENQEEEISIYKQLGLDVDEDRWSVMFELSRTVKNISTDDLQLAEKLGLSVVGLIELVSGIAAQYSTNKVKEMIEIIRDHLKTADEAASS